MSNWKTELTFQEYQHYCLVKTCSVQSKRRDQYQSDNSETNDKTKSVIHIIHEDTYLSYTFFSALNNGVHQG